jgi:hypothetical protein
MRVSAIGAYAAVTEADLLRAQFRGAADVAGGPTATANPWAAFEHRHAQSRLREHAGCMQTGDAGAENQRIEDLRLLRP